MYLSILILVGKRVASDDSDWTIEKTTILDEPPMLDEAIMVDEAIVVDEAVVQLSTKFKCLLRGLI